MMTNEDIKEYFLNEEGDWNSLVQFARDIDYFKSTKQPKKLAQKRVIYKMEITQ